MKEGAMGYKRQKYSASEELPISQRRQRRMMVALKAAHSAISPDGFTAEDFERQRRGQELLGRLVAPMLGMSWETFSIRHIPAAWVKPDRGHDHRRVILYCHGGGYTSGSLGYARILGAKLSHSTGYEVLSFAYRLAPEHTYPAALEDALLVWNYLMHQGYGARDVVVMGDSAGGNLALALTLTLREQKRRLPGTLVLFSPWTDMTCSGQSYKTQATLDPILSLDYVHATRQ
ncbi:MAG: alpha/beta hydrolase, partial [Clostridiales bacterium]|nr:alpha/beta hydrolase [Clostridiales bacterium]